MSNNDPSNDGNPPGKDFELKAYIDAFTSSSDRVRWVLFVVLVASIAALIGAMNERPTGWPFHRELKARLALHFQLWEPANQKAAMECSEAFDDPQKWIVALPTEVAKISPRSPTVCKLCMGAHDLFVRLGVVSSPVKQWPAISETFHFEDEDCRTVWNAAQWVKQTHLYSKDDVKGLLGHLEEIKLRVVATAAIPVLGLLMDMNDLGIVSGIVLSLLMMMLWFSSHRQYENLRLVLWKVNALCHYKKSYDDPGSVANLLYHSLAMAQVFTRPPTLQRWKRSWLSAAGLLSLLSLPFLVLVYVLYIDCRTRYAAPGWTTPIRVETCAVVWVLLSVIVVHRYQVASHKAWEESFFLANPDLARRRQPSWRRWIGWSWPGWVYLLVRGRRIGQELKRTAYRQRRPALGPERRPQPPRSIGWEISAESTELRVTDLARRRTWSSSLHRNGKFVKIKDEEPSYTVTGHMGQACRRIWPDTTVSRGCAAHDPGPLGVLVGSSDEGWLVAKQSDSTVWAVWALGVDEKQGQAASLVAGGEVGHRDGHGLSAGFAAIRAMTLAPEGALLVTDDACVRKVSATGDVSTISARTILDREARQRPFRSRLLGITVWRKKILVADFDLHCVHQLTLEGEPCEMVWESRRWWCPAALCASAGTCYLLEIRPGWLTWLRTRARLWMIEGEKRGVLLAQLQFSTWRIRAASR
jgi:hypothetical protein